MAILSGNDLEHALLALAAMHVGVPYAPISPAYSLVSSDHAKLRYVLELLTPGLVFAAERRAVREGHRRRRAGERRADRHRSSAGEPRDDAVQ